VAKNQQDNPQVAAAAAAATPEQAKVGVDWGEMVQAGVATLAKDWWEPEHAPNGEWFVWGGAAAEVSLPSLPRGTRLELDLMPHRGQAPLEIVLNGKKVRQIEGNSLRQRYWVGEESIGADGKNRLVFARVQGYVPSDRDLRPLSVQLFGVRAVGPGVIWAGVVAAEEERARCFVKATGVLDPEEFPEGRGVWTKPEAKLALPAGPGKLTITMWAPRPKPPVLEISVRGAKVAGPLEVGHDPIQVDIPVTAALVAKGVVELDLKATPFCPAKEGISSDARELGVVLAHVRFVPSKS
jgi:hypothetical protein